VRHMNPTLEARSMQKLQTQLMEQLDTDGDGKVSKQEFVDWLLSLPIEVPCPSLPSAQPTNAESAAPPSSPLFELTSASGPADPRGARRWSHAHEGRVGPAPGPAC
jgi:hypothetical protein